MANRFWVLNGGNWSDTAHWSVSTGGTGGASLPTSADNVYFNANSFSSAGQTVTVDATAVCLNMDWTGALYTPTLAGASNIRAHGNITFISGMILTHTGQLSIYGTCNFTTNGKTITSSIGFGNISGNLVLQDNLTSTSATGLIVNTGTLNTNGKTVNIIYFNANYTTAKTIIFGNSSIQCSSNFTINATGTTFDAGTSTIIMTGATKTFSGGGLTYNNVEFQGTPTTITGSNTFNDLKFTAGKTVNFTTGTTQTITTLSGVTLSR